MLENVEETPSAKLFQFGDEGEGTVELGVSTRWLSVARAKVAASHGNGLWMVPLLQ